jgi:hypothetical protein
MARPARLELATLCLEGRRSIQLSYGRSLPNLSQTEVLRPEFLPLFSPPFSVHSATGRGAVQILDQWNESIESRSSVVVKRHDTDLLVQPSS